MNADRPRGTALRVAGAASAAWLIATSNCTAETATVCDSELCECVPPESDRPVFVHSCVDSLDCPPLSVCRENIDQSLLAQYPPSTPHCARRCVGTGTCVLDLEPSENQDALAIPLDENSSRLKREDTAFRFTYKTKNLPSIVRCGVFGCPPVVRDVGGHLRIENVSECLLASGRFYESSPTFDILTDLRDESAKFRDESDRATCTSELMIPPHGRFTGLYVACWAYDDRQLATVSEVVSITMGDVLALPLGTDSPTWLRERFSAQCGLPGLACPYPSPELPESVGTCTAEGCRARCIASSDCPRFDATRSHLQAHHCVTADAYVGLCLPDATDE